MSDAIETVSRNIQSAMAANASDPNTAAAMHTPKFRKALRQAFGKKAADELLRNLSARAAPAPDETPKLPGDRIADARSLLWEAEALCHVGRAAYVDSDLDTYNMLGAMLRLLEGAQEELDESSGRLTS